VCCNAASQGISGLEDGTQRTGHVVIEALQLELPARDLVADHGQVVDLRRRRARRDGPLQVLELRLPRRQQGSA